MQEALTNTLRHARAEHFWVEIVNPDHEVLLTIRDDGQGFDVAAAKQGMLEGRGFGLLSMQERVDLFGGQIEIESASGRGAAIRIRFPTPGTSRAESKREES